MNYDHWKTTEPEPSADLRQCFFCKRILPLRQMWHVGKQDRWICGDCMDYPDEDEDPQ